VSQELSTPRKEHCDQAKEAIEIAVVDELAKGFAWVDLSVE